MPTLTLSLACDLNDRTQAILNGQTRPKGINLNYIPLQIEEIFWRMLRHQEFDAAEMSMSSYMMTVDRNDPEFIAIPAFPSRFFRHSCIFINEDASIDEPEDLAGKRVGVPEYQMTASLWIRGMLHDEYGVAPSDVHWFHGGEEDEGREEKLSLNLPDRITLDAIPSTHTLSGMLEAGELDALITARTPSSFPQGPVSRLFSNFKEAERQYYQQTGHFPIMHTIVIRKEVYNENPWVAQELHKMFREAKSQCLDVIANTGELKSAVPWLVSEIEQTRDLMGENYWPYGIEKNRETLEVMTRYSYEQGLTSRQLNLKELFAPETFEEFKV